MTAPEQDQPPAAPVPAVTVVVLAAGSGTRMRSKLVKVLHPVGGRTMIGHVLTAALHLRPARLVAVVGTGREQVGPHVHALVPDALLAVQESQQGTGHAVQVALDAIADGAQPGASDGVVVVMAGDTPLLRGETLARLVEEHVSHRGDGRAVTLLTAEMADPTGYGRVLRDPEGAVSAVVEQKDATPEETAIREVNTGVYAFDGSFLAGALPRLTNDNASAEYYLTDVVAIARQDSRPVGAHLVADPRETAGANDRVQLAQLGAELNRRTLEHWMRGGVTITDPATTWIDADVVLEPDVTLLPGVQLLGTTAVAEDAVVGPDCTLKDVEVGPGATVVRTHGELAVVGAGATVGPFSYLRPGTELGARGKIGGFVETKNARIGDDAKVPHLSYVGDAEVGDGTNIGAGTIVANFDGVAKHRTRIGRQARTGANNTFVAPVEIGDGAATGAGTVVRQAVPAGALGLSAGPQRTIEGWTVRRRPGTPMAEAAAAADSAEPSHDDRGGFAPDGPPEPHSP